jgi:hypothetical protein
MQFQQAWRATTRDAVVQRYKIIWKSYHFHRMNNITINPILDKSATQTVRPFLNSKDPDYLLATDIEFEQKEFFESEPTTAAHDSNSEEWHEVGTRKQKKRSPHNSPSGTLANPPSTTVETLDLHEVNPTGLHNACNTPAPHVITHTKLSTPEGTQVTTTQTTARVIHNPYKKPPMSSQASSTPNVTIFHANKYPNTEYDDISMPTNPPTLPDDNQTFTTHTTNQSARTHKTNPFQTGQQDFVAVNDGTLRITIRWKPDTYNDIKTKGEFCSDQLIKIIQSILHTPNSIIHIVPWGDQQINPELFIPAVQLNSQNFPSLRSPKIMYIDNHKTIVIGIRICATERKFSTSAWLNDANVKRAIATHSVQLHISNSTCNSGNMVNAGIILLKHPQLTHRLYFLMSLRRHLPPNTPYFDIGVHQRTLSGTNCPHLVVRCGEKHQGSLTEILSDYMNGKTTTALYIGTKILKSMSLEETTELFDVHHKYVNSIQRLPLSPQVVNLDRNRTEVSPSGSVTRSTREWANSILSQDGQSFQCDTENGGQDRKAYLLVPSHNLEQVRPLLDQYMSNIRNNSNTGHPNSLNQDRPNEIYVPTASVQRNVDFIRQMSSVDIWKNAPSAIRQATATQHSPTHIPNHKASELTNTQCQHPTQHNSTTHDTPMPTNNMINGHQAPNRRSETNTRHIDDNTTTTFQSNMTTVNSATGARFSELENAIKANQQEFQTMQSQFATMDQRLLETMETCHTTTTQMLSMQTQMNNMQTTVQDIAMQMKILTQHLTASHLDNSEVQSTYLRSPEKKKQRQSNSEEILTQVTTPTQTSTAINGGLFSEPSSANQGAQYTQPNLSDSAMSE